MKRQKQTGPQHQWITVEQLRAGDSVEVDSIDARVILVEQVDPKRVLVAFEGTDQVDYPAGAKLKIKTRQRVRADFGKAEVG